MNFIDLRSDTVTRPTAEMRESMAKAAVGDDVYGEDPTVNKLQDLAAQMTGKQAGLFVPSGTMGNLASILAHCNRGDEVIMGARAHTFLYEGGGISSLGGVHSRQILEQPNGALDLEDVRAAIRADDDHAPITRLIELENTHNRCGGTFQTPAYVASLAELAHENGLVLHLDGARVFNAAVAQGLDVKALTAPVDSLTFCLSKALAAPVGSVVCGSAEFIRKAKRMRKHLGGGMRQAGILAAAGIVALEKMVVRLAEDHARARRLAQGLRDIPALVLDAGSPASNMLFVNLAESISVNASAVAAQMRERGVLVGVTGERRFRLVLHYEIGDSEVEKTLAGFKEVLIS